MKITVDGELVYLGKCEVGVYVDMKEPEVLIGSTEMLKDGILVDYNDDGELLGVEILMPAVEVESGPS